LAAVGGETGRIAGAVGLVEGSVYLGSSGYGFTETSKCAKAIDAANEREAAGVAPPKEDDRPRKEFASLATRKRGSGTQLQVYVGLRSHYATLVGSPDGSPPSRLRLGIIATSAAPRFAQCRTVGAVVDGVPITIASDATYQRALVNGEVFESLSADISRKTVDAVATSSASAFFGCTDSIPLSQRDLVMLRTFATRWDQLSPKGASQPASAPPSVESPSAPPSEPPQPTPSASSPPAAEPPNSGCHYDTQCKGNRICQGGLCVEPPASP
jgi:hypothetical protein